MPGIMFQDLVSSRARAPRNWLTVPLSFLVHTAIIAVVVVVPLVATDALPVPRSVLRFISSDVMPVVPAPPPAATRLRMTPQTTPPSGAVPLVPPDRIGVESGVIFEPGAVETQALDGLVSGLGASQALAAETAPPSRATTEAPVRTGGEIEPPARTRYVAPEYPEIARNARVQGVVIVEAIIGTDGRVQNARVLRSSPLLDDAALTAVRAWEYTPTLLNGRPTAVIMTVTVRFDLK